jgi:mitochondrial cardiolipin hydrolase
VCVFTITDDRLADALLAAHRRGVAIRVLTDNDKAHDLGSDIERIAAAGVAVRIDRTPFHMHHKYAIFDGRRLLNGSYNWTRGAARDNQENVVVTDDPALVARFAAAFEALWGQLA